jgi:hypothetical protein
MWVKVGRVQMYFSRTSYLHTPLLLSTIGTLIQLRNTSRTKEAFHLIPKRHEPAK